MKTVNDPIPSLGLLVLRLGTGGLLIYGHGWGKVTNFAERASKFSDPIGLGPGVSFALVVFAEVFCSIAVMLGLMTRVAVIPIMIFTLVAAVIHHAADPFRNKEFALLYFVPALTLFFTGPGRFSLDFLIGPIWARRKGGRP